MQQRHGDVIGTPGKEFVAIYRHSLLPSTRTPRIFRDMPRLAIRPSRAIAELLRSRRRDLGLTLREVERRAKSDGTPIPFTTLGKIETGSVDPGLTRLQVLLRLYGLPINAAGDLLDMEAIAGSVAATGDFRTLRDRGNDAWQRGDLPTAMACYLAMRRSAGEQEPDRDKRHDSILDFAVLAGKLGKHHIARQMLDELALDKPAPPVLFRLLVQSASTWQALGAPQLALALVNGAETLVEPNDLRGRGWVLQLRASIQIELSAFDDARANLAAAARAFQKARRPYDRALALVATARLGVSCGNGRTAVRDARKAAAYASLHKFARVHQLASIQEGSALLLVGDVERALAVLTRVLAAAVTSSDSVVRFYCHFYLSKVYAVSGDPSRSRLELEQAQYFVRFVDPGGQEASEAIGPNPFCERS